jgi:hypothetical protein
MWKMIGKNQGRAEKSGRGWGRKDNVGIGGHRLWQAYHLLLTEILTVLRQPTIDQHLPNNHVATIGAH